MSRFILKVFSIITHVDTRNQNYTKKAPQIPYWLLKKIQITNTHRIVEYLLNTQYAEQLQSPVVNNNIILN